MRKNKLRFLLAMFAIVLLLPCLVKAQRIAYTYNAAGNRVGRQYVVQLRNLTKSEQMESTDSIDNENSVHVGFSEGTIAVFPNPTKGSLVFSITRADFSTPLNLCLYSSQGALLQEISVSASEMMIDLSAYASGWYILKVTGGTNPVEFKIIKQ